jgi:hypothetical protein
LRREGAGVSNMNYRNDISLKGRLSGVCRDVITGVA